MNAAKGSRPLVLLLIGALICATAVVGFALQTQTSGAKAALVPPTIRFPGRTGATFQCQLVMYEFATCTTIRSYSALTQGAHTFSVRLLSGPDVSLATSYVRTVDTTAPRAPRLVQKPDDPTFNATNIFTWSEDEVVAGFQCSVENGSWTACYSPFSYAIITNNYGQHQFSVRAVDAAGNVSAATSYSYKYVKGLPTSGLPFQITGSVSGMVLGVWQPIAVTITNPNGVLIYVSALNVAIAANSTSGNCPTATNVALSQSNVSASLTVAVPAKGRVVLPAGTVTAPQIRLIDLPTVNQDVCKGANFALTYSGTANN